jgi:hypothetical protein
MEGRGTCQYEAGSGLVGGMRLRAGETGSELSVAVDRGRSCHPRPPC